MQILKDKTYSIGDASRITGVSQRKLRSWEGKHIPKPERIVCGDRAYRRYTQTQINLISRIKEYQDQGFTLSASSKKAMMICQGTDNHHEEAD
jgi:DNA-binding transcriptional MerR regulator